MVSQGKSSAKGCERRLLYLQVWCTPAGSLFHRNLYDVDTFVTKETQRPWEDWVAAGTSRRSLEEDSPAWSYSLGAASCLCAWYKALYSPWSFAWWYLVSNSNQHHFSWEILLLVDLRPATTKSSTSPPNGPKNKNRKNKATQVIIFQRPTC